MEPYINLAPWDLNPTNVNSVRDKVVSIVVDIDGTREEKLKKCYLRARLVLYQQLQKM